MGISKSRRCSRRYGERRGGCRRAAARRGAALVETAISILLFVTLVVGLIDFGFLVFRYHVLAQAARQLARQTIVHGSLATELGGWGPASVATTAGNSGAVSTAVHDSLVSLDPETVIVQVDWIDGGNSVQTHDRVRVTVRAPVQLIVTQFFGSATYNLTASSTMPIAH